MVEEKKLQDEGKQDEQKSVKGEPEKTVSESHGEGESKSQEKIIAKEDSGSQEKESKAAEIMEESDEVKNEMEEMSEQVIMRDKEKAKEDLIEEKMEEVIEEEMDYHNRPDYFRIAMMMFGAFMGVLWLMIFAGYIYKQFFS